MSKNNEEFVKEITPQSEDYSQWYLDVIKKTKLVDYAPVKGCMVIRPYGYAIWEKMKEGLDRRIKETGHENAYFPLFIPESLLQKEADHVEGFAPEVAWITKGGDEELSESLAVRPTSEAMFGEMYSDWIQSWRDLPVLINQWANVVRWEKSTKPFLRTSEFLWQEGHTAHRTEEDAEEEALQMLDVYKDFVENDMAIPVLNGLKSEKEKFAGALRTFCIEALMSDGRALQAGTSHNLGQHFAKVFDITFLDQDDERKYVWQTSWGVSTRLIGALIMVHGDNRGLKIPPKVAPHQLVMVPITPKKQREQVLEESDKLYQELKDKFRVKLDNREEHTPGWKFNEWEMKGVPIRLEIGPKDIEKDQVVLVRRDTDEKMFVKRDELIDKLEELIEDIQNKMLQTAKNFLEENTHTASSLDELGQILEQKRGMIKAYWCGNQACEEKVKDDTKATIRVIPFEAETGGSCIACGYHNDDNKEVFFARAY
ncbi:proline--tRNA ligase [Natranaerobius thermophilus]|uniref:Proline--tRNA ligase n=1 Tax=Natranaerobius thermophilus (strain ATCC BAA-1301 / DSM 18059 / JW/NM-WN-LF) TaxID=457570 RepID=SYP_NATTJ|nr:proline--tRNA ligase [Natranaerobius thermophilus]B2A5T8.1 RecName: Full=Proline--tRNA ligase; AltName: Full=Prolyl-tRNA synthetase; Short=ProRS [Natranaerobius thermophilus JW/NM-WN-LF]ACB84031.1 prolyl-tRNA synthetase [Natranaerobius thermophilus JW/NM-WN-LF]